MENNTNTDTNPAMAIYLAGVEDGYSGRPARTGPGLGSTYLDGYQDGHDDRVEDERLGRMRNI